ncbi:SMI1/KNR4 family protein [Hyalangium versicolor]|uniref:SMI1/KNR4 family protein n=1 Tax=Hyalangium versicolor TaxID=2861190 RepID=UPI001CCF0480|nr:SMI1/KNR4 family protein [Hyalangium versicolor]
MSEPFQKLFEDMVAALRAHPQVDVYDVVIRPPASPDDIAAAEEALKRPLPADMRSFYLAHDGVFLSWGLKDRTYNTRLDPFTWPDYGTPPGVINLLPLHQVVSPDWVANSVINWTASSHRTIYGADMVKGGDKGVPAVVVDYYSNFRHADMVFGPEDRPAWMLIADDHGAELLESNLSSFSTYLDVVLAQWGTQRMNQYKVSEYRAPRELKEPRTRPTLEAVVADALAD